MNFELNEKNVVIISAVAFLVLVIIALFFIYNPPMFFALIILGLIVAVLPYTIYKFFEVRLIKNCENEFPNFLRDLAEAKRTGLSLIQAVQACANSDYGVLTKYIKRMVNQISWNIPFKEVLKNFRNRFKNSKIISYSVMVISEMEEIGGKIEDILDSLADNIENIKETYEEKRALMQQHVMTMYAIFFIFLGISITLIKFLMMFIQNQAELGGLSFLGGGVGGNPCGICVGSPISGCISCNIFFGICQLFNFGAIESAACYYKAMFFVMIIIQGIFSGLIAGQIASDSIVAGVKHSLVMTISGFIIFILASMIGVI